MIGIKSEGLLLLRKFITSKSDFLRNRRFYPGKKSLNDNEEYGNEGGVSSKNKSIRKIEKLSANATDIYNHFTNSDQADKVKHWPSRIVNTKKSKPPHLYLFDENVADDILDLIKDDLVIDPHKVIEAGPGVGVLTEKLLSAGVPSVRIMEPYVKFIPTLAGLQKKYPNRITIQEADLFNLWRLNAQDKYDERGRVDNLFAGFPRTNWGEESGLKIIGAASDTSFVKTVIMDIVRQSGLVSYGRPCLYLSMVPSIWMQLTGDYDAGHKSLSVLFQLFFDYKLLGQIPRKAFLPWMPNYVRKMQAKKVTVTANDRDYMYFTKIEAKKNLFTEVISEKHIQPLWYFMNHHLIARTNRVIPHMEAWQPGCGLDLIMLDYNIHTQFGDLNSQQLLNLFKVFTSWDGFQNSFLPSMENSLQKMEQLIS